MVFSCGKGADGTATKGALHAEIELQAKPRIRMNVVTTHLQSGYTETIGRAQIKELQQFIAKVAGESPYPILINGDFNLDARHDKAGYKYLCDHMNAIRTNTMDSLSSYSANSTAPLIKMPKAFAVTPSLISQTRSAPSTPRSYGSTDADALSDGYDSDFDIKKTKNGEPEEPSPSFSGMSITFSSPRPSSSSLAPPPPSRSPSPFMLATNEHRTIDLLKASYGFHPVTNGWGHGVITTPKAKWLTEPDGEAMDSERHCIDYVFFRPGMEDPSAPDAAAVSPIIDATRVRPFFTDEHHFTQISDHYGTECTLLVQSPKPPALPSADASDDREMLDKYSRCSVWRWKPCILIALILLTFFGLVAGAVFLGVTL